MTEDKPIYTYAVKSEDGTYFIPHHVAMPSFRTVEEAETDCRCYLSQCKKPDNLEHVVINIGDLVRAGIIFRGRLFGSGVRE